MYIFYLTFNERLSFETLGTFSFSFYQKISRDLLKQCTRNEEKGKLKDIYTLKLQLFRKKIVQGYALIYVGRDLFKFLERFKLLFWGIRFRINLCYLRPREGTRSSMKRRFTIINRFLCFRPFNSSDWKRIDLFIGIYFDRN